MNKKLVKRDVLLLLFTFHAKKTSKFLPNQQKQNFPVGEKCLDVREREKIISGAA
jgi:hypothetical protein